ncbi:MAG TPA: aminoglycoside phosphotransferase family protein [Thermomicrobiales bacterium]|nr:aminoglycoside phosphotransferase family protein [Thermomicrobiales bacterium]
MKPRIPIDVVLRQASVLCGQPLIGGREAGAGADHLIVFATTPDGGRVVVKVGDDAHTDAYVLDLLRGRRVPVPRLLARGEVRADGRRYPAAVMTRVDGELLAASAAPRTYLPAIVAQLRRAHLVATARGAGPLLRVARGAGAPMSWRAHLLAILHGGDPEFDWDALCARPAIDAAVLRRAITAVGARVAALPGPPSYRLLHGDLNPYNILIAGGALTGIIDWSYTRYGDPLFDFARLRMNLFVRQDPAATRDYFALLDLAPDARECEQTYYLFNLLEYVNWYAQSRDDARVRKHLALLARQAVMS